jgi:Ni/Fe-hydrogenase 1 B-type cytochrome subunit
MAATRPERRGRASAELGPRRSIYVFELPVRLVHWTLVLCLIVLSLTGLYLEHPFAFHSSAPAHPGFTFAEIRFIHEVTAFVFIAAVLVRIYWAFAGNEYAHWRGLLPITAKQRQDLGKTVRFYTFRRRYPVLLNGHNPLAGLAYVALYLLFIVTILTGLGLYAWLLRRPPWTTLFSWTWSVMSVPALRLVHYLLMFLYIGFAIHHVYSAVLYDMEEKNGELSSMVTGYKDNVLKEDYE